MSSPHRPDGPEEPRDPREPQDLEGADAKDMSAASEPVAGPGSTESAAPRCDHTSCHTGPRVEGSLAEAAPHLLAQWDCTRPGPSPWSVRPASSKKLHWVHRMPDGTLHRWSATGASRARLASGCGVCHPRKGATPGINDLATLRPDLAAQWCTIHQPHRPDQVTLGSKRSTCWTCPACGLHTRLRVDAKVRGSGCVFCAGQRAVSGHPRTLAVASPQVYAELDHASLPAGVTPRTLMVSSNRVVSWRCRHCQESFRASPNARRTGVGCPACSKQSSGVERDLRTALVARLPGLSPGTVALPIPWNSRAPLRPRRHAIRVDIHHERCRVVVEYDGLVHHRRPETIRRDLLKTELLLTAGYTVIRVRENDLPDLDLNHPRLHQVHHTWGSDIDDLADTLAALIRSTTHDPENPDDPDDPTAGAMAVPS